MKLQNHATSNNFSVIELNKQLVSLVAQTVKNLPKMQETWVGAAWEVSLKEGMATHSRILAMLQSRGQKEPT